jgi:hypothetical protein
MRDFKISPLQRTPARLILVSLSVLRFSLLTHLLHRPHIGGVYVQQILGEQIPILSIPEYEVSLSIFR